MSPQKRVIVILTPGCEEMEFTITVDVLRRAQLDVVVVGVGLTEDVAVCSRGVKIAPDVEFEENTVHPDDFDAIVLPGGNGVPRTINSNAQVLRFIKYFYDQKKIVAFICAAPLVAKAAGIPSRHKITSYPGSVKEQLVDYYNYSEDRIVVDENLITSRGPGTTFLFALTLVEQLVGVETSNALKEEMLLTLHL